MRRAARLVLLLAIVATGPTVRAGTVADDRFVAGLRSRQLFELAERFCRQQLGASGISDSRRADLVIQLSQTLAEHAFHAPTADQDRYWKEAHNALQDFIARDSANPRLVLVQLQMALVELSHAEQLLIDEELAVGRRLDEAHNLLRAAVGQLTTVTKTVEDQLRAQHLGQANGPGMLNAEQLQALRRNVQFQLVRGLSVQGRSFPAGSPDRINALQQAVELLAPLVAENPPDAIAWQARLTEIGDRRLMGDKEGAAKALEQFGESSPPADLRIKADAERLELLLATDKLDEALRSVQNRPATEVGSSPEWLCAALEVYIAAWRKAAADMKATEAQTWQQHAAELAEKIERECGPGWGRKADTLLAGAISAGGQDDLSLLVRAGETFYRSGRFDDALSAYDRAREQAERGSQPRRAFDAGFTAAAIEQQRKHYSEASRRFCELALALKSEPRAADAHLLAIYNTAQLATKDPAALKRYRELLVEQLADWPHAVATDQARLWLARLAEQEGNWSAAIEALRVISPDRPLFADAVDAMSRCYRQWLNAERQAGRNTDALVKNAAAFFEGLLIGADGQVRANYGPVEQEAALAAARTWLESSHAQFAHVERLLRTASEHIPADDVQWQRRSAPLLASALAAQGREREALELVGRLAESDPDELLRLAGIVVDLARESTGDARRELGSLALATCEVLARRPAELTATRRQTLVLRRAQALRATGRSADAIAFLATAEKEYPQDLAIRRERAEQLLAASDVALLHQALEQWRGLETQFRPGSDDWFRAKYSLAEAHFKLGNFDRAAKIIELTQVLHPDLGGPQLAPQFKQLLAKCRKQER
jgi:tetratricopeptide (TPR) repeat protein